MFDVLGDADNVPDTDYFSLYEWNYSKAGDDATVAQVFGKSDNGDNAFLHIRKNKTVEVYVSVYDEKYLTRGKYDITINGQRFHTSFIRDGVLELKNETMAYKMLTSSRSFVVAILSRRNKVLGEYRFRVSKKLN